MTAFTPAAGRYAPLAAYDRLIPMTRDRLWRALVVAHLSPTHDELILDVGCGTCTLAVTIARIAPRTRVVGVDPDRDALAIARRKAASERVAVRWRVGMGDQLDVAAAPGTVDAVVTSLVLHQCPVPVKRAILAAVYEVLRPGGRLVLADFGLQRTRLMRAAFRIVQVADGKADTQPNADGLIPIAMAEAGFTGVDEVEVVLTPAGSVSIYVGAKG